MPTLADIIGGIESVLLPQKRRFANALRDPMGDIQQTLGLLDDKAKQFTNALKTSQEGGELARMNSVMAGLPQYRQASDYVTNALTNQVMNFAPLGMTKSSPGNSLLGMPEMGTLSRKEVQAKAKEMGLPATGKTEQIQQAIDILGKHPSEWSKQEFDLVAPHLWIHQDTKPGSAERVQSIMQNGLNGGMADNLGSIANGSWSWARKLLGSDAYVLPPNVKYRPGDSGYLGEGNKPLFHIKPEKGQDVYEALKQATKNE